MELLHLRGKHIRLDAVGFQGALHHAYDSEHVVIIPYLLSLVFIIEVTEILRIPVRVVFRSVPRPAFRSRRPYSVRAVVEPFDIHVNVILDGDGRPCIFRCSGGNGPLHVVFKAIV